jgi:KUP system potassium uptake protein
VFLTVTGAEALYADMGHFGRKPISAMWTWLVLPCLALNYLGQGALVLAHPETADNPFFHMAPDILRWPLVILATLATVIASQAVISGAFSLAQQGIQLGLLPRLRIVNTSSEHHGQIYMPQINYMLLAGVIVLVLAFKSSSAMASAYGISVIGAMITSTLLAFLAIRRVWKKSIWLALLITAPFLVVEVTFLSANTLKLASGGYVSLLIAATTIAVLWTWSRGTRYLIERTRQTLSTRELFDLLDADPPMKVKGTAIFLTGNPDAAPVALLHNLKHNKVLHEQIIILKVRSIQAPRVPDDEKIDVREVRPGVKLITMTFGFMETPNVSHGLSLCKAGQLKFEIMKTSFFVSHYTLIADGKTGMPLWQDHLFIFLYRNATHVTEFFRIPRSRVIEIGAQMSI